MEDDRTLADRLALVVQFYLAAARGQLLKGDIEGGVDTLRHLTSRWLAALAGELNSDTLFLGLPELDAQWEIEALLFAQAVEHAKASGPRVGRTATTPSAGPSQEWVDRLLALRQLKTRVNVRAITRALQCFQGTAPLAERFAGAVACLGEAGRIVEAAPREPVTLGAGNNHD